jgi:hypothetical protein
MVLEYKEWLFKVCVPCHRVHHLWSYWFSSSSLSGIYFLSFFVCVCARVRACMCNKLNIYFTSSITLVFSIPCFQLYTFPQLWHILSICTTVIKFDSFLVWSFLLSVFILGFVSWIFCYLASIWALDKNWYPNFFHVFGFISGVCILWKVLPLCF